MFKAAKYFVIITIKRFIGVIVLSVLKILSFLNNLDEVNSNM